MSARCMKRLVISGLLLACGAGTELRAQSTADIAITRSRAGTPRIGPPENFTGVARVYPLYDSATARAAGGRPSGGTVAFEAGARTAWHTHPRGQTLIVTAGVGRVQRWGAAVDEIRIGDVVWIPPGVKHWHGAAPTAAMIHVALAEADDGRAVDWMEHVTDAQYATPVGAAGGAAPAPAGPTAAQRAMGDIAPRLAELTDSVLYGDVWARTGLSRRDRSLATIASLIAMNRPDQLRSHIALGLQNGVTRDEIVEVIMHMAFYSGWPNAVVAIGVARQAFPDAPR